MSQYEVLVMSIDFKELSSCGEVFWDSLGLSLKVGNHDLAFRRDLAYLVEKEAIFQLVERFWLL